jgi:hypothetical protein
MRAAVDDDAERLGSGRRGLSGDGIGGCHGVASLRTRQMTDVILIEAEMHCVCYCSAAL